MMHDAKFRFENLYIPEPNSGCWLWIGGLDGLHMGYGRFRLKDRQIPAHRASWRIYRGAIPKEMCVLHRCDVPICVNPEHLFLGSNSDNMKDRNKKGRQANGIRHSRACLTESQVQDIRLDRRGIRAIGRVYGVTHHTIYAIKAKKTWRQLPWPIQRENQ